MEKKTFGQAFKEARKKGLDKFQWKGGWYSTKVKEETKTPSNSSIEKGNYKQKYTKSNGTVSNRFVIKNHGKEGYSVYDNEIGRYIGNLHKDKQSAINYLNSDKFKEDSGEFINTAALTKLDRNTAGFQPVDENKNYQNKQGTTRLFQENGTGRYLVTDNHNNIVGYSFDPAAATADSNWGGWIAYTGNKNDLKAAGSGKLRDEANRNEINQKAKQAKDRMIDDRERQLDGIRRMQGGLNTIQSMLNIPNHAITGGIKLIGQNAWDEWTNADDYAIKQRAEQRKQDYLKGFTVDGMWNGEQMVGAGDLFGFKNPYVRFAANMVNPISLLTLRGGLGRNTTKGEGYNSHAATHNADAHIVQTKVTGNSRPVNLERMNVHQRVTPEGPSRITDNIWNNSREQVGFRTLKIGEKPIWNPIQAGTKSQKGNFSLVNLKNGQVTTTGTNAKVQSPRMIKATYERSPMTQTTVTTTPRIGTVKLTTPGIETTTYNPWISVLPFNAAFRFDPKNTNTYSNTSTPTANFWYSGEGNPNTYAQGRIATGEVVPGTSGENWNGDISGSRVDVQNTKGYNIPAFSGITVGMGKDNKSKLYTPVGYHKQGTKLIPRKR